VKNIAVLISRDFSTRVKTTSYVLTTILGVLLIFVLAFIPVVIDWFDTRFEQTEIHLLLVDKTNLLGRNVEQVLTQQYQGAENVSITPVSDMSETEMVAMMTTEGKTGILVIEYDELGEPVYSLHTTNASNISQNSTVQRIINQAHILYNADRLGLSFAEVSMLLSNPDLRVKEITPTVEEFLEQAKEVEAEIHFQSWVLAYLLLLVLYMALMLYGNMVASGVAEEKSSQIMEVMVSMVKPLHLMIGKIVGIGALGLLQFIIWIATGIVVVVIKNIGFSISSIPLTTLLWFAFFFILGYLFYATIFAAAGALVSRVEEVQQVVTVLMMGIIVGFIISYASFMNPNSSLATVTSLIPLFSPMVMFSRLTLTSPPTWQVITSIALLIGGIVVNTWLGAKIYRICVLMYGKRPRLKEVLRYITE